MEVLKMAILSEILIIFLQMSMNKKQALGRILRRACGDYADFSFAQYQKALPGYQIKTVTVSSRNECEKRCVNEYNCKSVNLQLDVVNKTCELNSRSAADFSDGVSLSSKPGWMFSSTSYKENLVGHVCKQKNPCPYAHLCIDVCYRPGYKCIHCKQLSEGKTCERSIYNIAFGKPTRQSKVLRDSRTKYTGKHAVDGDLATTSDKCIHTYCPEINPWWGVDFQGRAVIFAYSIWTRTDTPASVTRVAGLEVRVGDKDHPHHNTKVSTTIQGLYQRKEFATPKKGRFFHISAKDSRCLDFCEVNIEGYLE